MTNILKVHILVFLFISQIYSQNARSLWVVRDALLDDGIVNIVDNAKRLGCNNIFIQLRGLGKVYYPTKLDIPSVKVDSEKLRNLFVQAKQNNIDVHIWLNYSYIASKNSKSYESNHVLNKARNSIIYAPDNGVESEGYFLHPNDKTNLSEVKSIIIELVNNYEFKGIHLDYFRYPGDPEHSSITGRTNFILQTGLDPLEPIKNTENFIDNRGIGSYSYFKEKYSEFLRTELTETLSELKSFCKTIDNNLQISVAVKPNPLKAKHKFYQDWAKWIEDDLCDFIVLMNYSVENEIFEGTLNLVEKISDPSKIIIGIAAYNINSKEFLNRINIIQNKTHFKGLCLFSYNYFVKNTLLFNQIESLSY